VEGEPFTFLEGSFFHVQCWPIWRDKEISRLEELDETRGLRPRQRARLADLKSLRKEPVATEARRPPSKEVT